MRHTQFYDLDGNELRIQNSSLATQDAYRIYFAPTVAGKVDTENEKCIHLNKSQALILINAIQDLFND